MLFFMFLISIMLMFGIFVDTIGYFIAGVLVIIFTVINLVYRYGHLEDNINIESLTNQKKIYKEMAEKQLAECKTYLCVLYPQIEKAIFDKIIPENVSILSVKFPEIKSDKTISKYVDLINSKTNKQYECDLEIVKLNARIKLRLMDSKIWVLPGLLKGINKKSIIN